MRSIVYFYSGLDSLSSLQCVALLREIARSGRTVSWILNHCSCLESIASTLSYQSHIKVVTTIHQPSSRILDYFDHLYIVTNGYCMYQGDVESLIPFFKTVDLICPSYHNPADFGNVLFYPTLITFKVDNSQLIEKFKRWMWRAESMVILKKP